jgi:hypothetical protein
MILFFYPRYKEDLFIINDHSRYVSRYLSFISIEVQSSLSIYYKIV